MYAAKLAEMERQHGAALANATEIRAKASVQGRQLTPQENEEIGAHVRMAERVEAGIADLKRNSSLVAQLNERGPGFLFDAGRARGDIGTEDTRAFTPEEGRVQASAIRRDFGAWVTRAVGTLTGQTPRMEATAPSGVISEATGTGLDSVAFATPTAILPFLKSYFQYSPFEKAGASIVEVAHMRNINVPVVAAGADPAAYAEGAGPAASPSGSNPFGLSGFTMGANKRSRQVIATYESLQSTEVPMQPIIIDELLTSLANVQTKDATTALFNALTAPPGVVLTGGALPPQQIGGSGVQADVYGQLTALRHSLVEGLEDPTNSFMLSRNTLGIIRNTRASTSGVVMFDPEEDLILGRPYYTNEYFDSVCGAGFVAYGNWNRGAWLRRSPLVTRVLDQLYWLNSEIGFVISSWTDNHFVAELVGATQPPTHQPVYFTVLPSGSLP